MRFYSAITGSNNNLASLIQKGSVIVDFHASWCSPCRLIAPLLEKATEATNGQVKLIKVDVDENQESASKYGVNALPTVIGFKDGKELDRFVGVKNQSDIQKFINKLSQ